MSADAHLISPESYTNNRQSYKGVSVAVPIRLANQTLIYLSIFFYISNLKISPRLEMQAAIIHTGHGRVLSADTCLVGTGSATDCLIVDVTL